jgi:hypothetical protein
MIKEDVDKLKRTIEDGIVVYEDVVKAKESDDKITLMEGGLLVVEHAGKAVRFVSAIPELGREIVDIDSDEAAIIVKIIADNFGGSDEAFDGVKDIAEGAGKMNQGIQKLIALKKD